jgi:DNA-binding beta-propeller fold protein YncE
MPSPGTTAAPVPAEIVAVASRDDQKLTLIDATTGKVSGSVDLGLPVRSMALTPDAQMAWVFSSKPTDLDFVTVDLLKGERKDSIRVRQDPSAAAFSTDGRRAFVALAGGNDSPPQPNTVVLMDTSSKREFGHVEVGQQNPGEAIQRRLMAVGVAPGSSGDVLYVAGHASGTVWALDGGSGSLVR